MPESETAFKGTEKPAETSANKERVQLWVDALRSGEFNQGAGVLRSVEKDGDKFCCLGVACEVAMRNGVKIKATSPYGEFTWYGDENDSSSTYLPEPVADWYGLSDNPEVHIKLEDELSVANIEWADCTLLNDSYAEPFSRIADFIEREYINPAHVVAARTVEE